MGRNNSDWGSIVVTLCYFRAHESAKTRIRMQLKRKDPDYREKERQRDRVRRAESRKNNQSLRNREKERDRVYQYLKNTKKSLPEGTTIHNVQENNTITRNIHETIMTVGRNIQQDIVSKTIQVGVVQENIIPLFLTEDCDSVINENIVDVDTNRDLIIQNTEASLTL